MKIKTSELSDIALDWAVAKGMGELVTVVPKERGRVGFVLMAPALGRHFAPSRRWEQGGPIIGKHVRCTERREGFHYASIEDGRGGWFWSYGKDLLEAGLRVFVMSRLGHEIDVPDELMEAK